VVDAEHKLVGFIRLQDLVLRHANTRVSAFMFTDIVSVAPDEDQAVVAQVMQRYDLVSVPVIADDDELLGVVTFDDIADIIEEESSEDMLYLAGVTDEETSTTSPFLSVRRRLPWLAINLGNAFITSMVVSQFQGTIGKVTALAALMPIVGGMGGNAAIQSITVMVRSMALGDVGAGGAGRAVTKEVLIGLMNGVAMGLLAGVVVALIWENVQLGLLISTAMLANLFVAGLAGSVIPLALRKMNFDPALSSGPLVTNLTDVTGYLVFLGLATLTLGWLLG
jgi:magnesium transporter